MAMTPLAMYLKGGTVLSIAGMHIPRPIAVRREGIIA